MKRPASPRKKRVWNVSDFAEHAQLSHGQAKRLLKKLDARHGGRLLIPSDGANREYTFYPAVLSRLEPDLFAPVESLEFRLEELEEKVDEQGANQKRIASQVGYLTRKVEQLDLFRRTG